MRGADRQQIRAVAYSWPGLIRSPSSPREVIITMLSPDLVVFAYFSPETFLPLTSVIASAVGVFLLFGSTVLRARPSALRTVIDAWSPGRNDSQAPRPSQGGVGRIARNGRTAHSLRKRPCCAAVFWTEVRVDKGYPGR